MRRNHGDGNSSESTKSSDYYELQHEENSLAKPLMDKKEEEKLKISSAFNSYVLINYILSDMVKKPKSYIIGILTVSITVAFFIIIYNILDVSPVIFLKLSQNQVGESDFIIHARPSVNMTQSGDFFAYNNNFERKDLPEETVPLVNTTYLQSITENSQFYAGFSPRWFGLFDFTNSNNPKRTVPGVAVMLDSAQEIKIGLGRDFSKTLLGYKQAFVTRTTLKYLGIKAGKNEEIQIFIDL